MFRTELKEGTRVFTSSKKEVGKISRFVLDPETNDLTHIVVQGERRLSEDRLVPVEWVRFASEDRIVLNENAEDLNQLPPFEERNFNRVTDEDGLNAARRSGDYPSYHQSAPAYYWYTPYGYPGFPAYGLADNAWRRFDKQQKISSAIEPLKEGAKVISSDDKHVGNINWLFLERQSNKIAHFLISVGRFSKDQKMVPANWIESVREDKVHPTVPSDVIVGIPSFR